MKRRITSPMYVTLYVVVALTLISYFIPTSKKGILLISGYLVGMVVLLLIHELGHGIAGIMIGARIQYITIGPLTFYRNRFEVNDSWWKFGGVVKIDFSRIAIRDRRQAWKTVLICGPLTSLIMGVCLMMWPVPTLGSWNLLSYLGITSCGIGLVTINPRAMVDGGKAFCLWKDDDKARLMVAYLTLGEEILTNKSPCEWDVAYVELAKNALKSTNTNSEKIEKQVRQSLQFLMYYYYIDSKAIEDAEFVLSQACENENRGVGKFDLVKDMLFSLYATHLTIYDDDVVTAKRFMEKVSKREPYSYHRGKAAISVCEGNVSEAKNHLEIAKRIIPRSGFANTSCEKLERQWISHLEQKLKGDVVTDKSF